MGWLQRFFGRDRGKPTERADEPNSRGSEFVGALVFSFDSPADEPKVIGAVEEFKSRYQRVFVAPAIIICPDGIVVALRVRVSSRDELDTLGEAFKKMAVARGIVSVRGPVSEEELGQLPSSGLQAEDESPPIPEDDSPPPVPAQSPAASPDPQADLDEIGKLPDDRLGDHIQAVWQERFGAWRQAAHDGNPVGQWLFGRCQELGLGVAENLTEAVTWYRKAAEQGHAGATTWGFSTRMAGAFPRITPRP